MKRLGIVLGSCLLAACSGTNTDGDGSVGPTDLLDPGHIESPPPAQGASVVSLEPVSPAPAGKTCPAVSVTSAIPDVSGSDMLDSDTYLHHVIDGEGVVVFKCTVVAKATVTFNGAMQQAGHGLQISNGVLAENRKGTADITLLDSQHLSSTLKGTSCFVDAAAGPGNNFQLKAGSMWASFDCPSLEAAPNDLCRASGFFVLENCAQK